MGSIWYSLQPFNVVCYTGIRSWTGLIQQHQGYSNKILWCCTLRLAQVVNRGNSGKSPLIGVWSWMFYTSQCHRLAVNGGVLQCLSKLSSPEQARIVRISWVLKAFNIVLHTDGINFLFFNPTSAIQFTPLLITIFYIVSGISIWSKYMCTCIFLWFVFSF